MANSMGDNSPDPTHCSVSQKGSAALGHGYRSDGMVSHPIAELPGLSGAQIAQLNALGIQTTFDLLRQGNSLVQRQQLSQRLETHIKYINKWTALANLARIPSVGCQHCGLLLNAGVSTPQQLASMTVQRLHPQLRRCQVQLLNRADLAPDTAQVATWIRQAQAIARP